MFLTSPHFPFRIYPPAAELEQEPIASLPTELMLKIFSYLGPLDLGRSSQVNRQWQVLAKDDALWRALIPSIAFGAAKWNQYFGDVGVEPPLPPNIHKILSSPCPFWSGKKVEETHLLVLVPQTVNGKPLTLKSLGELVGKPKQGNATQYSRVYTGEYTDTPVSASHWVLMSRDVLEGSRDKSYANQQALVASHAQKIGVPYQVPHLLDAAVSIFMEYVQSGTRLYGDNPWTYTRCQERHMGELQLIVGSFSSAGLRVSEYYFSSARIGVGCSRQF